MGMKRLAAAALLFATACGTSSVAPSAGVPRSNPPTASADASANLHLYVSNQSFDRPSVDIAVFIDDRTVVPARPFAVEGQHNWILFDLRLEKGDHRLRVVSEAGKAELSRSFRSGDENWVVLDYWCCGEPGDPRFTFTISDRPAVFG